MLIILCSQCLGFDTQRPATCTAQYVTAGLNDTRFKGREFLCNSCANNPRIYTDIRPLDTVETLPKVAETAPIETPRRTYHPKFQALMDLNEVCNLQDFEELAYRGYISYGISMTDGHYAPEGKESFLDTFRRDPINSLYRENDRADQLAPMVNSYIRIREAIDA